MLSGSLTARATLRNRACHLAELMSHRTQRPSGFNILTCIGYFDQAISERFGFAYGFPPNVIRHMPFTLHELLTSSSMPALGTPFKLALSLSRTLNLLHTSGWLHKSIRSNTIAIFRASKTSRPEFESPYLLGFSYSRSDGYAEETFLEQSAIASTNQLYRHPEVQGQHPRRYVASDDIYSLGLVLLEIALWIPLAKIEGRRGTTSNQTPLNLEVIGAAVSALPRRVGIIYTEAFSKSAAEWNAERLRNQNIFYWDVAYCTNYPTYQVQIHGLMVRALLKNYHQKRIAFLQLHNLGRQICTSFYGERIAARRSLGAMGLHLQKIRG
ncbi:hypothetical protein FMUND_6736 [Fusarium mundagurra]|uniref:Protein kinase domain-containing protein n=1 Tax=Fusarium mundagurra TaxID=1567541 RepID=A0A8H5YP22_9HYPO|nr:hypothetical protein FMUND_6736 [Fusarium mundagurra]